MSLTYKENEDAIPIAKITSQSIIYLNSRSNDDFPEIPTTNLANYIFQCPYCKHHMTSKQSLIYHLKNACKQKDKIEHDSKCKIECNALDELIYIPNLQHEVIFITGVPNCGKSYFANQYARNYKKLYDREIFLFTRLEQDDTLDKNLYTIIKVTDDLLNEKFEISDFKNSLCIFDDIETATYPKATKYIYELIDDLCKNGRHENINILILNQECRMSKKSKVILSCITKLVIFPKGCSTYQTTRLLNEHVGLSLKKSKELLQTNSRWILISTSYPRYIMSQHLVYMINKEIY